MTSHNRNRLYLAIATSVLLFAAIIPLQSNEHASADDSGSGNNPSCAGVAWTRLINTEDDGFALQKTSGAPHTWDAGAISMQTVAEGDASVTIIVDSLDTYRMFGFGYGNSGVGYQDIEFAAYLAGSELGVVESGRTVSTFEDLAEGDRVRVSLEGGLVNYYHNGRLFYTSATRPSYPLVVDSSIADIEGLIVGASFCVGTGAVVTPTATSTQIGSATVTSTATSTATGLPTQTPIATRTRARTRTPTNTSTPYSTTTGGPTQTSTTTPTAGSTGTSTPTPTADPSCRPVSWTAMQNVTVQGNSIYKVSGSQAGWDAGATSAQIIFSGSGYAQATVDETSGYKAFGLSWGNRDPYLSDIDYAFYMAGGSLKVYEDGVLSADVGAYAVGDVLKVAVEADGLVHFYRNEAPLYTSSAIPTYPLDFDTAISTLGAGITNAFICGANISVSTPTATFTPTSTASWTTTSTVTRTYTSTPTYTASVTGVTSATSIVSRTPTPSYTATQSATATPTSGGGPTLDGCPMFPASNIWNRNIASLPVHSQSDQFVASLGVTDTLHPAFGSGTWDGYIMGHPYITVPGSQPLVAINIYQYPGQSDLGPARVPTNAPISAPPDSHAAILENGTCTLYEMYHATPVPDGSWSAGSASRFNLNSNNLRPNGWTSADAAGFAILPALVRYDEAMAGPIRHAIRFTGSLYGIRNTYVWPARHSDGQTANAGAPPMGTRFRLKASVDISSYPQPLRNILQGIKDYGMFLADSTDPDDSWNIGGVPDSRWNNDMLHRMNDISGSSFEAVDESGLMIDVNSGQSR